jgi:hypothetical protein
MSAMFYLSRGAAPEGPFEEARLVYMIQSGELTQGGVCPVGQNQWLELHAVPAFAQALAARSAQAAPQYGAPAAPQYGAPAPAYAPQYNHSGAPNSPQVAPKKSHRGVLIAALVGILLLVLVAASIGAYTMFFSSGGASSIAKSVPQNSELFVEVPSVHKLVSDLHDVQYMDSSLRDDKQVFDSASDSITKAFDISQADALALLVSSETFGIAGRKLSTTPEVVLALGMKNSSSVETLLKGPRFVAGGSVGQTGKRYSLTAKPLPPGGAQDPALKVLSEAEIGAGGKAGIVWFPKARLLALGDVTLIADMAAVIESGAASIAQNLAFQAAGKDFDSGARLRAFLDPGVFSAVLDPKAREMVESYFTPAGPLTGSMQVKPAGFVTSLTGHITGSKLPRSSAYAAPQALNLGQRLPQETFAYMAASTRSQLSGADTEKMLLDQIGSVDTASRTRAEQHLRQLEQMLGVSASKLLDGIGGQSVLGIATPVGTSVDMLGIGTQALAQFNLTWVLELKDDSEYKKLAAELKQKILPGVREVSLTDNGTGFTLTPRSLPLAVSLRVKFLDKYLFVTAGANTLCDRSESAFSKGERTLKDDAAHKSALAALPDTQHFLLWVDTGRLGDTLLKNPLIKAQLAQSGMSLDKIRMTGPERVVSAVSVRSEVQDQVWTYHLDALNMQAFAPLGGAGALLGSNAIAHLPGL